jgi:glyoxylase-like metal-dependent hydrolase (beta-lactamase superfamily II)
MKDRPPLTPSSPWGRPTPRSAGVVEKKFGPLTVILGGDHGRYPHCNSLFVDDEIKTVIDPGCSVRALKALEEKHRVHRVIFSHYHEDHTRCARLFPDSEMYVHEADLAGVRTVDGLLEMYGVSIDLDEKLWLNALVNGLMLTDLPQTEPLTEQSLSFGRVTAEMIHTPGHTPGHVCFLFPEQDLVFSADIDLDRFGPYYGDEVSNLSEVLTSIEKLREIRPKILVTGHVAGIVTEKVDEKIIAYREIVFEREKRIFEALSEPLSLDGLAARHPIYKKKVEPYTIYRKIERNMIRQHLLRLTAEGKVEQVGADLFIQR